MSDGSAQPHSHDQNQDHEHPPRTPFWVKIAGIGVLLFVLFVAVMHLTGHSMGHHMVMTQVAPSATSPETPKL
jgi:hypothetical protein